jgi:bifunctional DNA-binding transcriptional regulator/antitoxin component of YhaV-PrlF toxin-antitoxin module
MHIGVTSAKVFHKGRVVIPALLQAQYEVQRRDVANVTLEEDGQARIALRFEDPIEAAYGMLAGGPDYTRLIVEEHTWERERERAKVRA